MFYSCENREGSFLGIAEVHCFDEDDSGLLFCQTMMKFDFNVAGGLGLVV